MITTDEQGRTLAQQSGSLHALRYDYDTRGRLASMSQGEGNDERHRSVIYNAQGYAESVTDALNLITRYTYDGAGRVATVTMPNGRVGASRRRSWPRRRRRQTGSSSTPWL